MDEWGRQVSYGRGFRSDRGGMRDSNSGRGGDNAYRKVITHIPADRATERKADRLACIRDTYAAAAHRNYVTNIIAIDRPAAFDVDAFMKCRHADNHARPAPKAKSDLQY